ncbi:MAG: hypothetical protein ACREK5_09040 [Gemmatimonadota bacterium]
MRIHSNVLALALLVAARAAPVRAVDTDPRWQTFLGCWAPITEAGAEGIQHHILCFREDESGAVAIATVVDDEVRGEEIIRADGTAHPLQRESCTGTGTATWSADGARVYLSSTLRCGEDDLIRESAGVLALAADRTLIDLRAVGAEDQYGVRALRYRRLTPAEYPASMRDVAGETDDPVRRYAAAPLSLDDIVEAAGRLPSAAVEAMLVELPTRIQVDAETLLALADAGVDEEVIDVVVALAYPDQFAMATAPLTDDRVYMGGGGMTGPYYDPWMGYGGYGYNRYYGYSPFGYPYGWGFGGGTIIIVDRDENATSGSPGAAVKGHGYTRADDNPSSGGTKAKPRRESSRSSVDRSSGDRSNSRSSPSTGGQSGSTRKAQPKQPSGDS